MESVIFDGGHALFAICLGIFYSQYLGKEVLKSKVAWEFFKNCDWNQNKQLFYDLTLALYIYTYVLPVQ